MSFTPTERYAICGTGALHPNTLRRYERGETVRPVVLYRLKAALQTLGLEHRAPELFKTALGGAADPNPREVLEPADATGTDATGTGTGTDANDPEALVEI